ncbi:MerR family transcriptional regulator [Streptomyces sp. YGL11-2]|uniref:MerR family transcriptional regulator n=1 Tax=Streptomyces sp. YGL11-2 TaxID=3414028 RepID=UPI003CE9C9A2
MTEQPPSAEYRIEDLAHLSGATVRTIRAYQDRGLLPRPERRGRANVYGAPHLARLRQISDLLDRGYTLASIKELLEAWDTGRGLGGVLGLVAEIDGPWTDEKATRITRAELDSAFGGTSHEKAVAEAVDLGVLERVPGQEDTFLVPSPQELAVAAELHSAGVPLPAISGHLREVRGQVEHIASRFLDFTAEHVFQPFLDHPPTEAEAAEAAALVRRLRPLAQQTIDAELARAMRTLAAQYLRHHLTEALPLSGRETGGEEEGVGEKVGARRGEVTGRVGCASESAYVPWPSHVPAAAADAGPAAAPVPRVATGSAPGREPAAAPEPESAFGPGAAPRSAPGPETVLLPAEAVAAVRSLVGPENTATFIAAAAHREVQARTMDALASAAREARAVSETPDAAAPGTRGSDTGTPSTEAPDAPADDPHTDR